MLVKVTFSYTYFFFYSVCCSTHDKFFSEKCENKYAFIPSKCKNNWCNICEDIPPSVENRKSSHYFVLHLYIQFMKRNFCVTRGKEELGWPRSILLKKLSHFLPLVALATKYALAIVCCYWLLPKLKKIIKW